MAADDKYLYIAGFIKKEPYSGSIIQVVDKKTGQRINIPQGRRVVFTDPDTKEEEERTYINILNGGSEYELEEIALYDDHMYLSYSQIGVNESKGLVKIHEVPFKERRF